MQSDNSDDTNAEIDGTKENHFENENLEDTENGSIDHTEETNNAVQCADVACCACAHNTRTKTRV